MSDEKSNYPAELVADGRMAGEPHLREDRIRASDIWLHVERFGDSADDIEAEVSPWFRREQIDVALASARDHPDERRAIERRTEAAAHEHRARDLRRAADHLGDECATCGEGVLVESDDGPASWLVNAHGGELTTAQPYGDPVLHGDREE